MLILILLQASSARKVDRYHGRDAENGRIGVMNVKALLDSLHLLIALRQTSPIPPPQNAEGEDEGTKGSPH